MADASIGFIGGGRVTSILLHSLKRADRLPDSIVVSDTSVEVLNHLQSEFPHIHITSGDNAQPAAQDWVFMALHPPAMIDALRSIQSSLRPDTVLVSLAPKLTIAKISEVLGGFSRIARLIPNAPSLIGQGYNPVVFAPALPVKDRMTLLDWFRLFGQCPEVAEDKLEAYAILTAMGPTYLWFQWEALREIGQSFNLDEHEIECGLAQMIIGAVNTLYKSGLTPVEVMDLIPVKPLSEFEDDIRQMYHAKLEPLYAKLKS